MTPLEKIELIGMRTFKPPSQCGKEKRRVANERKEFVENVLVNIMNTDGLTVNCRKKN